MRISRIAGTCGLSLAALLAPAVAWTGARAEGEQAAEGERAPRRLAIGKALDDALPVAAESPVFSIVSPAEGPVRLLLRRGAGIDVGLAIEVGEGREGYEYVLPQGEKEAVWYPVVPAGETRAFVKLARPDDLTAPLPFHLEVTRAPFGLEGERRKEAEAALARALGWLEKASAEAPESQHGYVPAMDGLVLAALAEEADPAALARLEAGPVARLAAGREGFDEGDGKEILGFAGARVYEHLVATLGLSEAAARGSAKAKALLPKALEYILAAEAKPGGGWRYTPHDESPDISVTGWSVVALAAAGAAGMGGPDTRDALDRSVKLVSTCRAEEGFSYQPGGAGGGGDVRDAIGSLVLLLRGEEGPLLDGACAALDRHQPSLLSCDRGEEYPIYYGYYAIRADFLRGGDAFQRRRATLVEQLLRHQSPDGSFTGREQETTLGPRYATALAALSLRVCLERVPAYMRRQAQGF